MNSRRLIAAPEDQDKHRIGLGYHTETGRMSALGQKQTFRRVPTMSDIPPKADIARRQLDVR
jgi:hypothetical protein